MSDLGFILTMAGIILVTIGTIIIINRLIEYKDRANFFSEHADRMHKQNCYLRAERNAILGAVDNICTICKHYTTDICITKDVLCEECNKACPHKACISRNNYCGFEWIEKDKWEKKINED